MKHLLKTIAKSTPLYSFVRSQKQKRRELKTLKEWESNGRPAPPPHIVKQRTLRDYAQRYNLRVLVETGTFYGEMVGAMKGSFDKIFSIELSKELYENAKREFGGYTHIEFLNGDSGEELQSVMGRLDGPALFWLDAHYSGGITAKGEKDTPIFKELSHIFASPDLGHVVIIDDARYFGVDPAYPSIEKLTEFVISKRPNLSIRVENDSIRITPEQ